MAENAIKIKKILEAGKVVYPATILDAVKDAKSVKVEGVETNEWYGKTLREILALQSSGATAEVKALEDKLYVGTPAEGNEGDEGYVPAVEGDIPAIQARLDVIEGDAKTEGSIKKAAADAVATVVADAPESFDTLKEIAEWIAKDADNEEAFDAANRIVELESKVGEPAVAAAEGVEAKDATGLYKAIEDAVSDANSAIEALDVEETTVGDGNVTVTYSEEDGVVTISDVAVAEATAVFTAATEDAAAKLEVPADDAAKLLNAASVAVIKDYVDDHFSTEACSDTADYDDVF